MANTLGALHSKYSFNLTFLRLVKQSLCAQKSLHFSTSTSKTETEKKAVPVQFSTNVASKVTIDEMLGIRPSNTERVWYSNYVLILSLSAVLIYFGFLREESDIDEILAGKEIHKTPEITLIELKIKLDYCKRNRLPTEALMAKIEELEKVVQIKSPFVK